MRQRFMYRFWLDVTKQNEHDLGEYCEHLKAKRQFTSAVRDGLRLIRDLRAGNLTVLIELFPWIERAWMDAVEAAARSAGDTSGNGEREAILTKLETIQRVVESQNGYGQVSADSPQPLMVSGNLKSLAGSNTPLPKPEGHDDLADLLEVKDVSSESGGVAAQNFINSMLAMQSAKSDKPAKSGKSVKRKRQSLDDMLEIKTVGSA